MPINAALTTFAASVTQCDSLIANAHGHDANTGVHLMPPLDREQITVAAFLNMFIAWETFLESVFAGLLSGHPTISGRIPIKYASPSSEEGARNMLIGTQRYFDYANHQFVIKMAKVFFDGGDPFLPHLNAAYSDLEDLRTMRNASAHLTSTTQTGLDALASRLFANPTHGISLYQLLTANDPRAALGRTIFQTYRDLLLTTATLIATG